jgi:hypothetical protein
MFQISIGTDVQIDPSAGAVLLANPVVSLALSGIVALAAIIIAVALVRRAARLRFQKESAFKKTVLLITVPKESAEKGDAGQREKALQEIQEDIAVMESVFASIGGQAAQKGGKAWLMGRDDWMSFEIVADKGLVSFYIAVPERMKEFVEQQIQAQYPHAQVEEVPDYNIFTPQGVTVGTQLLLKRESMFPIKTYKKLESDPLNGLTNALSKIGAEDGAAIQILVRSARKQWRERGVRVTTAMNQGKSLKEALGGQSLAALAGGQIAANKKKDEPDKEHRMSQREQEMVQDIENKIAQLGLDTNVRIVAAAGTKAKAEAYLNNIVGAFTQYNSPQYGNAFGKRSAKRVIEDFVLRHFTEKPKMVMTGEELASLYHMPLASTETPNIRWLSARKAPPPSDLPTTGLYVGDVEYRGKKQKAFIEREDRFRHMYLIGKSGSGKSEYIATMAVQDILNGDGVCVVDPHGDLIETVLENVPKERADDVIIFDPSDLDRPVALNMLEAPNAEMTDFVVGEMIAIFYKLFPPEMIGPMFEHNMRNFMLTLMSDRESPGTIAEIPRLISDAAFQKVWRAKVKDPVVKQFWENEIDKTSDFHKSEMLGYLISKVGRFVENAMMRNIIGQSRSAFDFSEIMNGRKIFLVNLSKGKIGDINANLLGLIIVTKLQMAAMSRANLPKEERKDFFLYIDEFQNFVTPSIATILSEARKYRLSLIIAHQYMGQLSPKGDNEIRDAVLGNVGSMFIGRIGIEDAEVLEKEFAPVFTAFDLVNVEKFTWNSKILIKNQVSRPFNIVSPPPVKGDRRIADAIKQLSRLKFGRDRAVVERDILERTALRSGGAGQGPGQSGSV